jgi:hypothetical protein
VLERLSVATQGVVFLHTTWQSELYTSTSAPAGRELIETDWCEPHITEEHPVTRLNSPMLLARVNRHFVNLIFINLI